MKPFVPVFQLEIRYNHILNFTQINRKLLAPYVKLASQIKIDNKDNLDEKIIFNFFDDDFIIIVDWDRIIFKGDGDFDLLGKANSPIEMPFLDILDKLKKLEEFGDIQNYLFIANFVSELKTSESGLNGDLSSLYLTNKTNEILDKSDDFAINLEHRTEKSEVSVTFGPYYGKDELAKRPIKPLNLTKVDHLNFEGIMMEYKTSKLVNDFNLSDFNTITAEASKTFEKLWKA